MNDQQKKDIYRLVLGQLCVYLLLFITLVNFLFMIAEILVSFIKYVCKFTPLSEKYKMLEQVRRYFLKYRGKGMYIDDNYVIRGVLHKNIMASDLKKDDIRLMELISFDSENKNEKNMRKKDEGKNEIKNEKKKNLDLSARSFIDH